MIVSVTSRRARFLPALPRCSGKVSGFAEDDREPVRPGPARADRLDAVGAGDADRDDRAVGGQRQPGHAGLAAGQPAVPRAGALRVDAEAAAGLQHRHRRVQRLLRGPVGLPLDRQRARAR